MISRKNREADRGEYSLYTVFYSVLQTVYLYITSLSCLVFSVVQRRRLYSAVPGRVFIATHSHSAQGERELSLSKGDKVKGQMCVYERKIKITLFHIQLCCNGYGCCFNLLPAFVDTHMCFSVISVGDGGFWEGTVKGRTGWFPAECVEEVLPQNEEKRPGIFRQTHITTYFWFCSEINQQAFMKQLTIALCVQF